MDIPTLWRRLGADTQAWLVAHNGEALTPDVIDALILANGGALDPEWLAEDADGPVLSDDAIDWIDATANGE